jgi:hypothetical protein
VTSIAPVAGGPRVHLAANNYNLEQGRIHHGRFRDRDA